MSHTDTKIVDSGIGFTISKWATLQEESRSKIIDCDTEDWQKDSKHLKLVAGTDISYPVTSGEESGDSVEVHNRAVGCVTICSFPENKLLHYEVRDLNLTQPYIPGYLAFRESEPLLQILNDIIASHPSLKPDVILVDGNGVLHPRRYGCACDIGLKSGIPTIGVAKNLHKMESIKYDKQMNDQLKNPGDYNYINDESGIVGMALRTTQAKNPVYLSVGHKISLKTALKVVMLCCKYRVPEPIRFADFHSRERLRLRLRTLSSQHPSTPNKL